MKTGITINSKASTCLEPFDARLIESLAFTVNSHGDRTPEGHFDNERTMTYETVYTRLNTKRAAEGAKTGRTTFPDVVMQGGSVRFSGPVSWRLALCLLDGRRLHAQQLQHQLSASLPSRHHRVCAAVAKPPWPAAHFGFANSSKTSYTLEPLPELRRGKTKNEDFNF